MVLKCVLIVMQMVGDGGWFDGWVDGWVIFDRPLGRSAKNHTPIHSPDGGNHYLPNGCLPPDPIHVKTQGREVVVVMVDMVLMLMWC